MTVATVEPLARALRESGLRPAHPAAWFHIVHMILGARTLFEIEIGRIA